MGSWEDDPLIGQKIGNLTVIKRVKGKVRPNGKHPSCYLVECDCGERFLATGYNLKRGYRTMCAYCAGEWIRPE